MIKVFVSHKKEDSTLATGMAAQLKAGGLEVYVDVIDQQLTRNGPDLAEYIRGQLERCTQLLAVISNKTVTSWWVPWEIGVATEKERFLASFIADNAQIPEYLEKWPYLRSNADLAIYIQQSKLAQSLHVQKRATYGSAARGMVFRSFHQSLKSALRQPF